MDYLYTYIFFIFFHNFINKQYYSWSILVVFLFLAILWNIINGMILKGVKNKMYNRNKMAYGIFQKIVIYKGTFIS